MDNKEAITRIKNKRDRIFAKLGRVAIVDALDLAIKLMEQMDVLDKIRAEIEDTGAYEQEINGKTEFLKGINYCLGVIDKYKTERSGKE